MAHRTLVVGVTAAIALMALAGAGCGDDDGTEPTSAPDTVAPAETEPPDAPDDDASASEVDACGLLAGVDLEVLLGEPASEPVGSGSSCQVDPVAADSTGSLRVEVTTPGGAENYAQQKGFLGVDREVEGLGDEAFLSGTFLNVLVGDTRVLLAAVNDPFLAADARVEPAEIEAAMAVILENLSAQG